MTGQPGPEPRSGVDKTGVGAGLAIGTIIIHVINSLPPDNPYKPILQELGPAIGVTVGAIATNLKANIVRAWRADQDKADVSTAILHLRTRLREQNLTQARRDELEAELAQQEQTMDEVILRSARNVRDRTRSQ